MRSRRLRADANCTAGIARHERAATRADGVQIDGRQPNRETAHDAFGDACCTAARQQADIGRRAAHVERDRVVEAGAARDEAGADDASRRSRYQNGRRVRRRSSAISGPSSRLRRPI